MDLRKQGENNWKKNMNIERTEGKEEDERRETRRGISKGR